MPRLALAIALFWFLSLFVVRSFIQWRRTGSTGVKGFHGRIGSLPWLAGVSASVGLALAPLAPVATVFGWPGGSLLWTFAPAHGFGAVIALVGVVGALAAQLSMGDSWRVGVDEEETTALVTEGMFSWVRNPIFSFILLSVLGLILLVPSILSLLAAACVLVGIEAQVRAVEEPYLRRSHGASYRTYERKVGRFVPGVGRLRHG